MPSKFAKIIPRRKSSGNALDDFPPPTEHSFKVLERPQNHSFDGGSSLNNKRRSGPPRPSIGHYSDDNLFSHTGPLGPTNRDSDGTTKSSSSTALDSSASQRFSDASTIPSSTDVSLEEKSQSTAAKLRDRTRAFSFGGKKKEQPRDKSLPPPPLQTSGNQYELQNRPRAETESSYASESTARPPRLLDGTFDDVGLDLDFDNFGKRRSKFLDGGPPVLTESPAGGSPRSPRRLAREYFNSDKPANTPPPPFSTQLRESQSSPYSWRSKGSQENLLSYNSPILSEEPSSAFSTRGLGLHSSRTPPLSNSSTPINRDYGSRPMSSGHRRDSSYASAGGIENDSEDIELLRNSQAALKGLNRRSMTFDAQTRSYDSRLTSAKPDTRSSPSPQTTVTRKPVQLTDSLDSTPRAKQRLSSFVSEEESLFDKSSLPSAADIKRQHRQNTESQPVTQKKVMTPAQFEQYKKEQERARKLSGSSKDSTDDESGDDYEDDEDLERDKQASKQRRKQEAHLAVYRQQMMKVTGETPTDLPSLKTSFDKMNVSTPNLMQRSSTPTFSLNDGPAQRTSDDEDEEVPLGILAAHGFPNKARPPAAGGPGTNISFRSETYPPPAPSTAGASRASVMPAFARKLPQDPYYGAGLVNQPNRESLAFGNKSPSSISSASPQPQSPQQQGAAHPAGLVGVIAGEERARAARRGSPNAQGGFNALPQGMQQSMMDPNQASQQQMAQMAQFMQTQMQFMQQMQTMMAQGLPIGQQQQPPMVPPHMMQQPMSAGGLMSPQMAQQQQMMMMQQQNGMLSPNGQFIPRPMSQSVPNSPAAVMQGPRSQSMLASSGPMPWGAQQDRRGSYAPSMMSGALLGGGGGGGGYPTQGYTPSIAPSERSNVGMPSRYRPVSISPSAAMGDEINPPPPLPPHSARPGSAMSMSSTNLLQPSQSRLSVPNGSNSNHSRPVSQLSSGGSLSAMGGVGRKTIKNRDSDSDEEEGWEAMKAKRDAKRMERLGKKQGSLLDVYVPATDV